MDAGISADGKAILVRLQTEQSLLRARAA